MPSGLNATLSTQPSCPRSSAISLRARELTTTADRSRKFVIGTLLRGTLHAGRHPAPIAVPTATWSEENLNRHSIRPKTVPRLYRKRIPNRGSRWPTAGSVVVEGQCDRSEIRIPKIRDMRWPASSSPCSRTGVCGAGPGLARVRDGLSDEDIRGRVGASAAFDAAHLLAAGEDRVVGTIEPTRAALAELGTRMAGCPLVGQLAVVRKRPRGCRRAGEFDQGGGVAGLHHEREQRVLR